MSLASYRAALPRKDIIAKPGAKSQMLDPTENPVRIPTSLPGGKSYRRRFAACSNRSRGTRGAGMELAARRFWESAGEDAPPPNA